MKKHTKLDRSGPVYIGNHSSIISLVEEAHASERELMGVRLSRLRPRALYVIDDQGVRRIRFASANTSKLALALLAVLCAPLQYLLLARRPRGER
ncbi:MAG: hypothetical protein ABJA50_01590 [Chloroflexota bacterium]